MFRNRDAAVKLAIGLSALLVGIAFGRWGATPARPVKHKEFGQITSDIFQQLAGSDLTSGLTRAQAITDPGHYQALRGALGVMAQSDPAGALRLAAAVGEVPYSEPLTQMIYRQWSQTDPTAAAAAARRIPPGARVGRRLGAKHQRRGSADGGSATGKPARHLSRPDQGSNDTPQRGRSGGNSAESARSAAPIEPAQVSCSGRGGRTFAERVRLFCARPEARGPLR